MAERDIRRRSRSEVRDLFKIIDAVKSSDSAARKTRGKFIPRLLKPGEEVAVVDAVHHEIVDEQIKKPSVAEQLGLLPQSAEANWQYAMKRDQAQVGEPSLWGERTDLMEIYRRYRSADQHNE